MSVYSQNKSPKEKNKTQKASFDLVIHHDGTSNNSTGYTPYCKKVTSGTDLLFPFL